MGTCALLARPACKGRSPKASGGQMEKQPYDTNRFCALHLSLSIIRISQLEPPGSQ